MVNNYNKFFDILIKNSVSKILKVAITEWDFVYSKKEKNKCICGHNILENCIIENTLNYNKLIVGNCCVKKFMGKDYNYIFKGIKSIKLNKIPNKDFILYCYEKGYLYENQKDFLLKMYKKRKFSDKQKEFKNKILFKLTMRGKW